MDCISKQQGRDKSLDGAVKGKIASLEEKLSCIHREIMDPNKVYCDDSNQQKCPYYDKYRYIVFKGIPYNVCTYFTCFEKADKCGE
jgi:hypothetical protein